MLLNHRFCICSTTDKTLLLGDFNIDLNLPNVLLVYLNAVDFGSKSWFPRVVTPLWTSYSPLEE